MAGNQQLHRVQEGKKIEEGLQGCKQVQKVADCRNVAAEIHKDLERSSHMDPSEEDLTHKDLALPCSARKPHR